MDVCLFFVSIKDSVAVRLDNCTFHESVDLSNFEATRTIVVKPPQGEVGFCPYCKDENVELEDLPVLGYLT